MFLTYKIACTLDSHTTCIIKATSKLNCTCISNLESDVRTAVTFYTMFISKCCPKLKFMLFSTAPSPSRQERFNRMKTELSHRGKEEQVEDILEKLADALEEATDKMDLAEKELRKSVPFGPGVEHRAIHYVSEFDYSALNFVLVSIVYTEMLV